MQKRFAIMFFLVVIVFAVNSSVASEKEFERCRSKLKQAQKLDVLKNLEYNSVGIPEVTVGPTFYRMPIDAKQGFAETVNCFLMVGEKGKYVNFPFIDWQSGKHVGTFKYGKVKMY